MKLTQRQIIAEGVISKTIGFILAYAATKYTLHWFGDTQDTDVAFWITVYYTVISVARSWVTRSFFNHWFHRDI